jgi:hypothetical protein
MGVPAHHGQHAGLGLGGGRSLPRASSLLRGSGVLRLVAPVRAHPEQTLLQFTVGGQFGGRHLLRDAAVDHDADAVGHAGGHAQVLLDQQHGDRALV